MRRICEAVTIYDVRSIGNLVNHLLQFSLLLWVQTQFVEEPDQGRGGGVAACHDHETSVCVEAQGDLVFGVVDEPGKDVLLGRLSLYHEWNQHSFIGCFKG